MTLQIEIGHTHCRVRKASPRTKKYLRQYLTFRDPKAHFIKGRRGDGKTYLYDIVDETFPAGFLPMVLREFRKQGVHPDLIDRRDSEEVYDHDADLAWLYDYQLAAVEKAARLGRGILKLPTGSGKTEIGVGLTRRVPVPWLFIAHRAVLMRQAAARYDKRNEEHGIEADPAGLFGDGEESNLDSPFVCTTFQTLASRIRAPETVKLMQNAGGIMVDEAHVLPADSFYRTAQAIKARYRIGLSATPLARTDKRSLLAVASLGPVIYQIKPELLIERGVIARPSIRVIPVQHDEEKVDAKTYQGVYGKAIVRSTARNKALLEAVRRAEKPCLIFVQQIKHGKNLVKMLEGEGYPTAFISGKESTPQRNAAIQRLERGDMEVLIASVVFQEGVDIPDLRSVVIGSGGKSTIAALQRIGRGMRTAEGKDTFEVWDIDDRGHKWLERHSRARLKAYAKEGHQVSIENSMALF